MRTRYIAAFVCCLLAASCSDRSNQTTEPAPRLQEQNGVGATAACLPADQVAVLIRSLYRAGEYPAALPRFMRIERLVIKSAPDTAAARTEAFSLIRDLLGRYRAGRMVGGQSPETQDLVLRVLNGILCMVGLPQPYGTGSLGPDGAAAFIYPTTPDTTVVTQTGWAGVEVPLASVTQPTIVTIQRLPDTPGPLLTIFDQYPIYYEFHSSPAMPFTQDLVVGVCVASNATPPDPDRLRLAHNVAPFTANSAVILPLAPVPFVDCTNAPLASAASRWGFDLARARRTVTRGFASLLLPQPLLALPYYAAGGVGGTVRNFSPFGAVDTLGIMTRQEPVDLHGPVGSSVPADSLPRVILRTPNGQPMPGVPVTFTIVSGGGSLGGASVVTDANGVAILGSWTGPATPGVSRLLATATMPAGSGLTGNPAAFFFATP